MKSIKEKAEILYPTMPTENIGDMYSIRFNSEQIVKKEGFVTGANYVLNLLSEIIHVSKDAYLKNNLFEMIKQLKK